MGSRKFLLVSGYVFLAWAFLDILAKIFLFEFAESRFLWFCTVSMLVLSLGLILDDESLLNSFLSMAIISQPFWIIDYVWISFFNRPLNGTSLFAFQPGFPLAEFLSSFRHFFMIPFAFYAVFNNPRRSRKSYLVIIASAAIVLLSTYFLSPAYLNINCVFRPCIESLRMPFSGIIYFILFLALIVAAFCSMNLALNALLGRLGKVKNKKKYRKAIILIFSAMMILSVVLMTAASMRYSAVPKYSCISLPCTGCPVKADCVYFYGVGENQTMKYSIENIDENDYLCNISMEAHPDAPETGHIARNSLIKSWTKYAVSQRIPYPKRDIGIRLKAECSIYLPE